MDVHYNENKHLLMKHHFSSSSLMAAHLKIMLSIGIICDKERRSGVIINNQSSK